MRFRTAIIWNGIAQFGQSGITLLSTIILARMLTPDDFGLVGIVSIFIAISQMMVDSEMGGSLLRKKNVDRTDYSTLFWYNLAVSVVIYIVLFFSAPLIADFYHRPPLTGIIRILCSCVIIHAFRVVQFIMILRELKFKVYALINLSSGVISLASAVAIAQGGYGYWALVWQQIIMAGMIVIMMEAYNRFLPSLTFSRSSFLYQFKFGINLLGGNAIITIANNISTNIIAKVASLQFTGYYTQTSRITTFFQTALGSICSQSIYPIMAKFERIEDVRRMYRRILLFLIVGLGSLIVFMEIFASGIILIVLGREWLPAVGIFRILLLIVLPACIQVLCRNVVKTLGVTRHVLIVDSCISLLLVGFMLAAAFISIDLILWSMVAAQVLGTIAWLIMIERKLNCTERLSVD